MVSSSGAASHLLATHTLSSPFLHRLLRDETAFQLVNKTIVGKSHLSLAKPAKRGEPWPCEACCTGIAGCCARATSGHAAAPPRSVMNVRRSIASPSMQDHTQLSIQAIKTGKDVGRNREAVRHMCAAEIRAIDVADGSSRRHAPDAHGDVRFVPKATCAWLPRYVRFVPLAS